MSTLSKKFVNGLRSRIGSLRASGETGASTAEWIFLVVGCLAIAGVVIAAVAAFVNAQIAQLPG